MSRQQQQREWERVPFICTPLDVAPRRWEKRERETSNKSKGSGDAGSFNAAMGLYRAKRSWSLHEIKMDYWMRTVFSFSVAWRVIDLWPLFIITLFFWPVKTHDDAWVWSCFDCRTRLGWLKFFKNKVVCRSWTWNKYCLFFFLCADVNFFKNRSKLFQYFGARIFCECLNFCLTRPSNNESCTYSS